MEARTRTVKENIEAIYPLSPIQEGILFHSLDAAEANIYVMQIAYDLRKSLEVEAFKRAWQKVVDRHPILRTAFVWQKRQKPLQVVYRKLKLQFHELDWRGIAEQEQSQMLQQYLREDRQRGFNLSLAPLMRLALIRVADHDFEFVWTFHHILLDGWSVPIISNEVLAYYEGYSVGEEVRLDRPRPYRDYIAWLQRQDLSKAESYWRSRLKGFLSPSSFSPQTVTTNGEGRDEQQIFMNSQQTVRLVRLAREHQVTLNTILQGAWAILLSRYCGRQDVLFGATTSGRPPDLLGVEQIAGIFINTLPVRVEVCPSDKAIDMMRRLQEQEAEARQYDYSPLVDIQRWSEVGRGQPLFDSILVFENYPSNVSIGERIQTLEFAVPHVIQDTNYPITLASGLGPELPLAINYDRSRFNPAAIARMLNHLELLLESIIANPYQRISELNILTQGERQQLIGAWNHTESEYDRLACLHEMFEHQVMMSPDAIAIDGGQQRLTYEGLNRKANQLARHLQVLGAGPDIVIGFCLESSLDTFIAMLAILKAGAAYVALDPAYPKERLRLILQDANVKVVVTEKGLIERLPTDGVSTVCLDSSRSAMASYCDYNLPREVSAQNLAYIVYTSGSSGAPKGVLIMHQSVANHCLAVKERYKLRFEDRVLQFASISFDVAAEEIFPSLISGATVVIKDDAMLGGGSDFLETVSKQSLTVLNLPASYFHQLVDGLPSEGVPVSFPVRLLIVGSEPVSADHMRRWETIVNRRVPWINAYGPSEATITATLFASDDLAGEVPLSSPLPIGRPIPNTNVYLLGPHHEPLPVGVAGELCIGGDGLARGYHNHPELTAERFIPNPFGKQSGARLYRTGDVALYLEDGNIQFCGRKDHQVKVRGYRIELGEIEAELNRHDAVQESVVIARQDDSGHNRLMAYVALAADVLDQDEQDFDRELDDQQLAQWEEVFDGIYSQAAEREEPTFDVIGWDSSYTGQPIGEDEMQEWLVDTVSGILSLNPRRTLEIGCGTGMILFQVAPHCTKYVGTDISELAISRLRKHIAGTRRPLCDIELLHRAADNFDGMQEGSFDLLILNSVVQYFPNIDYLVNVLKGAVKVLKPDGAIFIGDVRSLPLRQPFYVSVEMHRAGASVTVEELMKRVQTRMIQEKELLIDPRFFSALTKEIKDIKQVSVVPKRGRKRNELTQYRYQVMMRLGVKSDFEDISWLDWEAEGLSLDALKQMLDKGGIEVLGISGIPNARVEKEVRVLEKANNGYSHVSVGRLMEELEATEGVEIEDLKALEENGYDVELNWARHGADGRFDALLRRRSSVGGESRNGVFVPMSDSETLNHWRRYANAPLRGADTNKLTPVLRDYLKEKMPEYMVPSSFIFLERLPRTPSGKLDRNALPDPLLSLPYSDLPFQPPFSPIQQALASIFASTLGLNQVSIDDNFFELGGDSILSIQIIARANRLGIHLSPRQIFLHQTIRELAEIASADQVQMPVADNKAEGELELTPIQRWFFDQRHPHPHHYNQAVVLSSLRPLNLHALRQALCALVQHHDSLRLRFPLHRQSRKQHYASPEHCDILSVLDLTAIDPARRDGEIDRANNQAQASLDLQRGPIARAVLHRTAADDHTLLIVVHHLAVDGVSWRILLEDLQAAYDQGAGGQGIDLGPKTDSYKSWSERLARFARSEQMEEQKQWWEKQLSKSLAKLPVDKEGGDNKIASQRRVEIEMSVEETSKIMKEVRRAYRVEVDEVLMSGLVAALSEWSGSQEVRVEVEGHGRQEVIGGEVSRTVGWFTTIYPVKFEIREGARGEEVLKEVKEAMRRVPDRGIGYGIQRYLVEGKGREQVRDEEEEVGFNYLGQFDQVMGEDGNWGMSQRDAGRMSSEENQRGHVLEVNAMMMGGRLGVEISYSEEVHEEETVRRLGEKMMEVIAEIIEQSQGEGAGIYTPSDFPEANLSQAELDELALPISKVEDLYPLSPMQEGMLFHSLSAQQVDPYFGTAVYTFWGDFNVEAFKRAWQKVVDRHPILRTAFVWQKRQKPLQVVYRNLKLQFHELDWRGIAEQEQSQMLQQYLREDRQRGFNLSLAPLMRLALIRVADDRTDFLWSIHHLLLDGWSLPRLLSEVSRYYEGYSVGEEVRLDRPRPYRDYIAWLQRQDLSKAESYWRSRLKGFLSPSSFSLRQVRDDKTGYEEQEVYLSKSASSDLSRLARQHQVTLNTILQGAWAILLSRYCGRQDVLFGATTSGRPPDLLGVEQIAGIFINTLPVRVEVCPSDKAIDMMRGLQEQEAEARQYDYSPLVEIQRWSEVGRGQPLFDSILVFENYPGDPLLGKQNEKQENDTGVEDGNIVLKSAMPRTNYPLTVEVLPGNRLGLLINYDRSRFDAATIRCLLEQLQSILEQMLQSPQIPTGGLSLVTHSSTAVLPDPRMPIAEPIHEPITFLFEACAAKAPGNSAVSQGDKNWTYAQLSESARALAAILRHQGVKRGDVVVAHGSPSYGLISSLLGILASGGVLLTIDVGLPVHRKNLMLREANAKFLLMVGDEPEEELGELSVHVLQIDPDTGRAGANDELTGESTSLPEIKPDDAAYIFFTSGTTGIPKGVLGQHKGLSHFLTWQRDTFGVGPGDRCAQLTGLSFDVMLRDIFLPLVSGATLCLPRREETLSPESLMTWLERERISLLHMVPSLAQTWLMRARPGPPRCSLRRTFFAGEPLSGETVKQWREAFPQSKIINLYGPTETTLAKCFYEVPEDVEPGVQPVGYPLTQSEALILNDEGRLCGVGEPGEIVLRTPFRTLGYINDVEGNAKRFRQNPFRQDEGDKIYFTGDRGRYRPDGAIDIFGRLDHQVKIRGVRIELGGIEAALAEVRGVRAAAVVAREDHPGDKRLLAYVVVDQEGPSREYEIRSSLSQRLPTYLVPSRFIFLDRLPLTPNGKLDRSALPDPMGIHRSENDGIGPERNSVEIQLTQVWQTELQMTELWQSVLGKEPLELTDNFFDLGGHSLLALHLSGLIEQRFGIRLPPAALFQAPTIGQLSEMIHRQVASGRQPSLIAIQPRGSRLPFFCVHPMGGTVFSYIDLARSLPADQPFYGLQSQGYGEEDPIGRIEDMAARYIEEMRGVQPDGPYFVGGWSMGGVVAYEMAQQLVAAGQEVGLLAMLDSGTPNEDPDAHPKDDEAFSLRLVELIAQTVGLSWDGYRHFSIDEQLKHLLEIAGIFKSADGTLPEESLVEARRHMRVIQNNMRAMINYSPSTYPGRITLFRATEPGDAHRAEQADLTLGWKDLASGGVEIRLVSGAHESMVTPPHVTDLARQLDTCIQRTLAREGGQTDAPRAIVN